MYGFPQNYFVANFRTVNEQDGEDSEPRRKLTQFDEEGTVLFIL